MEQYAWLAVLTLAQAILIAFKILEKRNNKKINISNNKSSNKLSNNPHPCARNGERIARLEEGMEDVNRRLGRIEDKMNGLG